MSLAGQTGSQLIGFQFQNGAIKRNVLFLCALSYSGFNSKMVRLKAKMEKQKEPVILKFQFQNGAIKSDGAILEATFNNTVSIPKWCD